LCVCGTASHWHGPGGTGSLPVSGTGDSESEAVPVTDSEPVLLALLHTLPVAASIFIKYERVTTT
jgi:hypothetical protein